MVWVQRRLRNHVVPTPLQWAGTPPTRAVLTSVTSQRNQIILSGCSLKNNFSIFCKPETSPKSSQETETSHMKAQTVTSVKPIYSSTYESSVPHAHFDRANINSLLLLFMLALLATHNQCQYKRTMYKRKFPILSPF